MKQKVILTKDEENTLSNSILHTSLMHVISPFERAAADHKFQPFQYQVGSRSVYISNDLLHEVKDMFFKKLELFFIQYSKERNCIDVPAELREVFDDPDELNALSPELKEKLSSLNCKSLYDIMIKRRRFFERENKFNAKLMKMLDSLFEKHQCSKLFAEHYHPGY